MPNNNHDAIANPIIFTDLDGTLLDHDTYEWAPAAHVLDVLKARRIPVVLNSSKTLAELRPLRAELGLTDPVIAENGAFIDVPAGYFPQAVAVRSAPPPREDIQRVYRELKQAHGYSCQAFFELGVDGIAAVTGLSAAAAVRANERQATEPVLWQDTAQRLEEFCALVEARGLQCVRGGRFVHVMGRVDKASAMQDLMAAWRAAAPGRSFTCIALGDGPNDAAMLAVADIAVVVRGRHDQKIELGNHPHVVRTEQYGPVGWQNALSELLEI